MATTSVFGQYRLSGIVKNQENKIVVGAEVYNEDTGQQVLTDAEGRYEFKDLEKGTYTISIFGLEYVIQEQKAVVAGDTTLDITVEFLGGILSEVLIIERKKKIFGLQQLKPVEGTAIYAGKKTEVILLENAIGNLASNNARQLYAQVVGLNIYENSAAGLQLNIGGRGLDPNRTANFNTRQNGYDISADVLGYPESYYTPPAEALSEIQVVRGAASLQYGTQFGGLINFKMKEPNPHKKIEIVSRQSLGTYNLFTSFNSLSGTIGKFSYYTYYNYKRGDGFRDNSTFDSKNFYAHAGYQFTENTKLTGEFTYLSYLAQQPGGLNDKLFEEDPTQSNRTRNWFEVNWKLYALRLEHKFSEKTDVSLQLFGLDASRDALGFRINRVDQADDLTAARDLIKGTFVNFGAEARIVSKYTLFQQESTFLLGTKYYQANNDAQQGPGTNGTDADFRLVSEQFPEYPNQSDFEFPNLNVAVFGENVFQISDQISVTPGFRFEYIKTETEGAFRRINSDNAGNVILDEIIPDNRSFERSFVLLGLGASYKPLEGLEVYANASENYRSVTFSDINIVNPSFKIDDDITDESGFTLDLGTRGQINELISYDVGVFGLFYKDRIGVLQQAQPDGGVKNFRTNVGDAVIYGVESLVDVNLNKLVLSNSKDISFNWFANTSLVNSKYEETDNEVEFVPNLNFKTGLKFGYKNLITSIQYSHLSDQFTDASNASGSDITGVIGPIPSYNVVDVSLSYTYKWFKLEAGINNVLDESYFTQRASGYPGPGIIPAEPLTWYTTLQFKW